MKSTVAAALVLLCAAPAGAQDTLAAARTLYASASYEEALAALSNSPAGDANQVDEYRALCYLALGESNSATQALERIVKRAPLYALNELEVSPKLVSTFNEVRQRVLPDVVRELYGRARESFEAKKYSEAATQFRLMLSAIDEINGNDSGLSDLRTLGDGFLKLSEAAAPAGAASAGPAPRAANATPAQAPAPPSPAPAPPSPAPASPSPAQAASSQTPAASAPSPAAAVVDQRVYSAADVDVKPPIGINQVMPRWIPPSRLATTTFTGLIEVIVDEKGAVDSVGVLQGTGTPYDLQLVEAARKWRYQPATRGGVPVKYRRTVGFVLRGQGQAQPPGPGQGGG